MSADIFARNDAVEVNPPTNLTIHITDHGSDWYWTAFALFSLFALLSAGAGFKLRPAHERLFFYSTILSAIFMAVTYFTLASNLGWTDIPVEFNHVRTHVGNRAVEGIRQIFYARYVGWFLAFPAFIMSLGALAGATWPTTLFTVFCQEVFVVNLLIGALIESSYKWGYFVFGVVAYFLVAYNILFTFRKASQNYESAVLRTNTFVGGGLVFLLFLYPICWGLSEGGNVIQPDSEAAFYGVLDVLVFVVLNVVLQVLIKDVDFAKLGLITSSTPLFHEKTPHSFESHPNNNSGPMEPNPAPAPAAAPATTGDNAQNAV
ncbi:hypothetical protein TRICI_001554 [Trichomonascus ciferrii]|uniref:Opsin n=1 Tax=Trichomonascus ciferrii TaxID=44093 RepID=A0A642V845_9ASCO|nr:hypothetical protein TRICI_001554 [Trichomonascus ciferrii]